MIELILRDFSQIWFFSAKSPLNFISLVFWILFAFSLLIYGFVHRKQALRNAFLFLISLFFYYKTSGGFFLLLIFSTVVDYLIGHGLYRTVSDVRRRLWVMLSVFVNLSVLFYFKYPYFISEFLVDAFQMEWSPQPVHAIWSNAYLGTDFVENKILLPVGISFYTFQCLSYIIDIYRRKIEPVKSPLDFGFYVSFFPQLVAGPIVRASEFIPQLYKPYKLTRAAFGLGLFWIINGLIKKVVLADYIASNFADRVFAQPTLYSGFECLLALFAYSLQVYADFSGYTDVAIGVALLMGFTLTKNFNSPYKARNVGDFWKRWHISLSSWLKDYLYIPLGGNREGSFASYLIIFLSFFVLGIMAESWKVPAFLGIFSLLVFLLTKWITKFRKWLNTNINLMLTMLLGGLWHGSSWNFVFWGGLNGIGLVVYKLWKNIRPWNPKSSLLTRFFGIVTTLFFVTFTRAWFRSESWESAISILSRIWISFDISIADDILFGFWRPLGLMLLGYLIHWIPERQKSWYREAFINAPLFIQWMISALTILLLYQAMAADSQPFIYFQF